MKLSHLTDHALFFDTKSLVVHERSVVIKLLYHLKEIDRRKLYSDYKCSSLFDFCVRELGYSEASAQRRIVAARLLENIPEIGPKLKAGKLTLTNISQVNQFYKNHSLEEKKEILQEVEGLSKRECEKKLFDLSGKVKTPVEKQKRLSKDQVQVAIVLSDKTLGEIERLKALLGQDLSMDELVLFMATEAIKNVEKSKFKTTETTRSSLSPAKVGRVVPASMKREIYLRDKKCTNCGSIHRLNYDHRIPYARGGPTNKENLRILCFHCNQRARMGAGLNGPEAGSLRS